VLIPAELAVDLQAATASRAADTAADSVVVDSMAAAVFTAEVAASMAAVVFTVAAVDAGKPTTAIQN
jgi:hypothetical protein